MLARPLPKKGVALTYGAKEDVGLLQASWYYDWSNAKNEDPRFVPMSWNGALIPEVPKGYVLFMNEPENGNNAQGCGSSVDNAVDLLQKASSASPEAKWIVGGCGTYGKAWMKSFKSELDYRGLTPAGWHIHGYIEPNKTWKDVLDYWDWVTALFPGEIWVTEFGDVNGTQLPEMLEYLEGNPRITRYAAFANRLSSTETWYPSSWPRPSRMHLVEMDGSLTPLGRTYRGQIA